MRTKILLEATGKDGIFEDVKLEVNGSAIAMANILVTAMLQSEGFYEVVREAISYYEGHKKKERN